MNLSKEHNSQRNETHAIRAELETIRLCETVSSYLRDAVCGFHWTRSVGYVTIFACSDA